MRDPLQTELGRIGGPRRLDPSFRMRLEMAVIQGAQKTDAVAEAGGGAALGWRIDGPREMPSRVRARVESAMLRRPVRRIRPAKAVAAAIAALLVASTIVVVDRAGSLRGGRGSSGAVLALPSAPPPATPSPARVRPPGSLQGFNSAGSFLRYVRGEALKLTGPYGIKSTGYLIPMDSLVMGRQPGSGGTMNGPGQPSGMTAAPTSGSYSGTNVQEAGVDEPDLVKTDGHLLVVAHGFSLSILDVRSGKERVLSTVRVPEGAGRLLLAGNRVIHIGSLWEAPPEALKATHVTQRPWTKVTIINIADPAHPTFVSSMSIEGAYVAARLAGGVVRLIVESSSLGPPSVPPKTYSPKALKAAETGNKRKILGSFVGDWVPHFVVQQHGKTTQTGHVQDWSTVSRPPDEAGVGMITLLTIDPANPRPDNAVSVVGAGDIVYASTTSLYVTSSRVSDVVAIQHGTLPKDPITRIHMFDISDPLRARYVASGEVPGYLLNQFSLSEYKGYLRVASTEAPSWAPTPSALRASESYVTVLAERAGTLVRAGSLGDLGKGERIVSVRFIGGTGFVVTFRRIDPLFVIDLRKPRRPALAGQLKVPGFSAYLHPISETLLLGVGQDADQHGIARGLQFSLFDVADTAHPRRIDAKTIGTYGQSLVGEDHHAFLYWAPTHLCVVPAWIEGDPRPPYQFDGALAVTVDPAKGFSEPVRITHKRRTGVAPYGGQIERSLVLGGKLLTVSEAGVLVSDLKSFASRAWVPFKV
jgi:uncharacterized secreted protein with C-terminal beta-propeller domain